MKRLTSILAVPLLAIAGWLPADSIEKPRYINSSSISADMNNDGQTDSVTSRETADSESDIFLRLAGQKERKLFYFSSRMCVTYLGDIDGDGFKDIVLMDGKEKMFVSYNDGKNNFSKPEPYFPQNAKVGATPIERKKVITPIR